MLNHLAVKCTSWVSLSHCVVTHLFLPCLQGEIGSRRIFLLSHIKLVRDGRRAVITQGPWLQWLVKMTSANQSYVNTRTKWWHLTLRRLFSWLHHMKVRKKALLKKRSSDPGKVKRLLCPLLDLGDHKDAFSAMMTLFPRWMWYSYSNHIPCIRNWVALLCPTVEPEKQSN